MRRIARAVAAASLLLLGAADAQALDLNRPPFQPPVGPIEPGILDPVDLCLRFPQHCNPGDPPPNPCIENPDQCTPPPPPPEDECETTPALCEDPPVLEPEQPAAREMGGNVIVRADGTKFNVSLGAQLSFDGATFSLLIENSDLFTGRLVPKGKSGRKFTLFLDKPSADAFTAFVAAYAGTLVGQPEGAVQGDTTKLVLKLDEEGNASLKIKSQVLTDGLGEVVYKVNVVEGAPHS